MKKQKEKPKLYIVRKYIKACNVKEAIKKEPTTEIHDLWIDEKWQEKELASAIGFDDGQYPDKE